MENGRKNGAPQGGSYHRYRIDARLAPDIVRWPSRFNVRVRKTGLAKLLIKEILHYGPNNKEVILSRPCMYGVFGGPVGGFAPREHLCVGCLRCTTEFPEFVTVSHNPERRKLGDSFFTSNYVDALSYEVEAGLIPVRGAGYRGTFGGEGWDGMWTDMSEIVRPTRDGIHGREFISTLVDIGYKPNSLSFDESGQPKGPAPQTFPAQLPLLFDLPPVDLPILYQITARAAVEIDTLAFVPIRAVMDQRIDGGHIVPVLKPQEKGLLTDLLFTPRLIEMDGWDESLFAEIRQRYPETQIGLRIEFPTHHELRTYLEKGVHVFHLLADYHGRGRDNAFILDLIRGAHKAFVEMGIREEVTLIASGGMIAAEHIPKAILCGLDAVAIDTPLVVALQARFEGECRGRGSSHFALPENLTLEWGVQRLKNLAASWRDQLLEIMGAMGIREVRRLRGEMGRAMFMVELEAEAFAGVDGYAR